VAQPSMATSPVIAIDFFILPSFSLLLCSYHTYLVPANLRLLAAVLALCNPYRVVPEYPEQCRFLFTVRADIFELHQWSPL